MASRRLNLDRISNLPHSLLCHILSFLSAKEAVATSIFSKRWRFLWTWLTNLDFDDEELQASKKIFPKIVNRFLLLRRHDSPIKRFRLKWSRGFHSFDLNSLVRAAIAGEVEELVLQTREPEPIQLPLSIFSQKALVILKLRAFKTLIDVPSSAHFPNLKTLHLQRIQFKDLDSVRNLFSTCSALEELTLEFTKLSNGTLFEFPCCCVGDNSVRFSNKLVSLKLSCGTVLNVPAGGVLFPRLKSLELLCVKYKDDNSVRNLLSGCPVLQKLEVGRYHNDNACHYEITSHNVRDLRVRFWVQHESPHDVQFQSSQHTLRLNTPAVKYLRLEDEVFQHIHFGNMDSLVKATISHLPCDTNHGHGNSTFLKLYVTRQIQCSRHMQ